MNPTPNDTAAAASGWLSVRAKAAFRGACVDSARPAAKTIRMAKGIGRVMQNLVGWGGAGINASGQTASAAPDCTWGACHDNRILLG